MGAVLAFKRKSEPAVRLQCMGCGATADVACNCGKPYVPISVRAAEAVRKNPTKSNRAIADEAGISYETVRRARQAVDTNVSTDRRTGKDGKSYRPTKPKKKPKVIKSTIDATNLEMNYEELRRELIEVTDRYRHLPDRQIKQALDSVKKQL